MTSKKADTAQTISCGQQPHIVAEDVVNALRTDILNHFHELGIPSGTDDNRVDLSKEAIRSSHSFQRKEVYQRERSALASRWDRLLDNVADGSDINPSAIKPELELVDSESESGYLFRFACLIWSVPVSKGYGRRMRFLVRDGSNGKLIGIFALGDPVFNLNARDAWIGWNVDDRRHGLVNMMDAYVVGAIPPYSQLLCGKLVASLIGSAEVNRYFHERYNKTQGVISKEKKLARLVLVTVTSALGRSSLYNRLKLMTTDENGDSRTLVELLRIGETRGYGHFHLSNGLFERIRELLEIEGHPYASNHQFGQGPNWRMRVVRVALKRLGLDEELVRHGIIREVYAMPLAANYQRFLRGEVKRPIFHLSAADEIASAALKRWVLPRADRMPEYKAFRKESIVEAMCI